MSGATGDEALANTTTGAVVCHVECFKRREVSPCPTRRGSALNRTHPAMAIIGVPDRPVQETSTTVGIGAYDPQATTGAIVDILGCIAGAGKRSVNVGDVADIVVRI